MTSPLARSRIASAPLASVTTSQPLASSAASASPVTTRFEAFILRRRGILLALLDELRDGEGVRHGAARLVLGRRLGALVEVPALVTGRLLAGVRDVRRVHQLHVDHREAGVEVLLLVVLGRGAGEGLGPELVVVDPHLPEL